VADLSPELIENFYGLAQALYRAKRANQDGIWKFILINNYKPFFLHRQFDYVIGNPPWLPFRDLERADYQLQIKNLAKAYGVVPSDHLITHLELAAIFWAHCANYFLKNGAGTTAQIGFVVPRSFLSSDHHDNTRAGRVHGVRLTEVWDLNDVSPLFNVPACVLIGQRRPLGTIESPAQLTLSGVKFEARLPAQDLTWEEAAGHLTETSTYWHYVQLGKRSAFSTDQGSTATGNEANHYSRLFKQGATIVPRNFYFIELDPQHYEVIKKKGQSLAKRTIYCTSSLQFQKEGKKPWKDFLLRGRLYTEYLFRTVVAKNILPFALIDPPLVVLPVTTSVDGRLTLQTPLEIFREGQVEVYEWFDQVETLWEKHKTENNKKISFLDYLNWQNKLTIQNLNTNYWCYTRVRPKMPTPYW
jgi:methylase of polypeptide subunit release factors